MDKHIRDREFLSTLCDGEPGVEELKGEIPGFIEDLRALLTDHDDLIHDGDEDELKRIWLEFWQRYEQGFRKMPRRDVDYCFTPEDLQWLENVNLGEL